MEYLYRLLTLLSISAFLQIIDVHAQSPNISVVVPPSPTAASLGAYGDVPVSYYNGQPSISIPLYELDAKGFKLPITLDYRVSGIKVEEEASWVGLGWSLSAGGVITRAIRGLDDIPTEGNVIGYPDLNVPSVGEDNIYYGSGTSSDLTLALGVLNKQYDTEPDIFYFNFLGYSGKFILKKRLNTNSPLEVQLIAQQNIRIQVYRNLSTNEYEWSIATPDGNHFIFRNTERTKSYTQTVSGVDWQGDPQEQFPTTYTSSWYLSQINTARGEIINFTYTNPSPNGSRRSILKNEMYKHFLSQTDLNHLVDCGGQICEKNVHYYTNSLFVSHDIYLKNIDYKGISIEFLTTSREDLIPFNDPYIPNTVPQRLTRMLINRVSGVQKELYKSFDFNSAYFDSGSGQGANSKRLKLISLKEQSPTESMQPYVFSYNKYNGIEIADKNSKSKDHWGNYNGKNNDNVLSMGVSKTTTIPRIKIFNSTLGSTVYVNGANREMDENFAKIGTLSSIKYPTGGYTEFNYEPHDYYAEGEYNTISHTQSLYKSGELITNPDGPDVVNYTLNLSHNTLIEFLVAASNTSSNCNVETADRIVASIINTTTNVPIHITLNIGCNKSDRTNYIKELNAGTYNVVVYATSYFVTEATLRWHEQTTPLLAKAGGGLRVKDIKKSALESGPQTVTKFSYKINNGLNEISSGRLMSPLVYDYEWWTYSKSDCGILGSGYTDDYLCFYNFSESSPNIPLSSSATGSPVGYSQVTVEVTDGSDLSSGKTVYNYINEPDIFDYRFIPTIPNLSNGLLTGKSEFKKMESGEYSNINHLVITYRRNDSTRLRLTGLKTLIPQGSPWTDSIHEHFKFYSIFSEWWHKIDEVYTEFNSNGNVTTNTQTFFDNYQHKLPTKIVSFNSDGTKTTKRYFRPADYTPFANAVLDEMSGYAFMHNNVVEEIVEIEKDNNSAVKEAVYTQYGFGDIGIVPKSISKLIINGPKQGFINSLSNGLSNDPDYKLIQLANYDPWSGNIVENVENEKQVTSIIWGYGHLYPIAKIVNATRSQIESVISAQDLAFFGETSPTDQEVRSFLEPLRISAALKDAEITTYTYKPLVGVSSTTDSKGMTIYYEYDGLGRLRAEKDHLGRVIKAYGYHYKGQ